MPPPEENVTTLPFDRATVARLVLEAFHRYIDTLQAGQRPPDPDRTVFQLVVVGLTAEQAIAQALLVIRARREFVKERP